MEAEMVASDSDGQTHGVTHHIQVADLSLVFRPAEVDDHTPTGAQVAVAAGFKPLAAGVTVMRILPSGELEDIRPTEVTDLRVVEGRFIVVESDRSYRFAIDGQRFDWPCRVISGAVLRRLGSVPSDRDIYLERQQQRDRPVGDGDLVDLDKPGVESFVSHKRVWKLNVQGVLLELDAPTIVVRDALQWAGFNPDQGWQIFLKIVGSPKEPVELTAVVDLRRPGIEKLRLTPKEINNGKSPNDPRREFAVLDADEAHLSRLGLKWETFLEAGRRWLLLYDYPLPSGYSAGCTMLALEIPPNYPAAQLYGFYVPPTLALDSGRVIESTQMRGVVNGVEFHGWSRNRGPSAPWNPATDNVITQLALVDASLAKEVGE
jgi:Prokaryotic E2 family E/Multiubiquitin